MEKTKCKVCGEMYANVLAHARTGHGLSKEDYEAIVVEKPIETPKEDKVTITKEERTKAIFGEEEDMLMSKFIEDNDITKEELMSLIKRYKKGSAIPVTQMQERIAKSAVEDAVQYKDQEEVQVTKLSIAEVLVDTYGFVVEQVKSGPPKTWFLKKK
jgi:hypothetical protein